MNTSIKLGNQYGCGVQSVVNSQFLAKYNIHAYSLNCRMFITLFSYFNTAALLLYTSR